jgi:tartrate dehydratase beta subunit/fumarate hydratase class I family protein
MLVVDKLGRCLAKIVPVNSNFIGTPYCTSATASFHSTFQPRQPGEYMIGVIPTTAADYKGKPSRFLHGCHIVLAKNSYKIMYRVLECTCAL